MKKRTKIIILIIVLLIILLIPIGISTAKGITIHFKSDEEIAQSNKEAYERELERKANFSADTDSTNLTVQEDIEIPELDKKLKESEEEEQKMIEVIRRFYPEEFDAAMEESKNEQDTGLVEITTSALKNYERKMYDIILRILEEENLAQEEATLLKDEIKRNMYNINKDDNLKTRAEQVLSQD